ncbi:MAG: 2-hydroxyacyl-CoA dehydratase family protein [Thermodesulfobacteriota bacterium]|nr:2-hydroxyacyl-CoA dehydratase family protein [Thermodesulfobacteriota bacterium]
MMNIKGTIGQKTTERLVELELAKEEGTKIVGYYPSEYMPEELVLAAGMIPYGLLKAGDYTPILHSGVVVPRWQDTFCRAQIGYIVMKDPHYMLPDLYVDAWSHFGASLVIDNYDFLMPDMETLRIEVPHVKNEAGLKFYIKRMCRLKEKLEEVSGNKITEESLRAAIKVCNRERELLKEIALLRKQERVPISGLEFMLLNHATYILDKEFMNGFLEEVLEDLKKKKPEDISINTPRVMVVGAALGMADYQVFELVEDMGGQVVIEQFSEAMKDFYDNVDIEGDVDQLISNIGDRYFMKKVCNFAFRPASERQDFIIQLAKDYKVQGMIWYQQLYQDNADFDYMILEKKVREGLKIPMLKLYTEYDSSEKAALVTRIETFLKTLR